MRNTEMKLPGWAVELLCCPACGNFLDFDGENVRCQNEECASVFPVIGGVPVLLDSRKSVFSAEDFINRKDTYYSMEKNSLRKALFRITPKIGANIKGRGNYRKLVKLLIAGSKNPKVLVLGGAIKGEGIEELFSAPLIEFVETDISF